MTTASNSTRHRHKPRRVAGLRVATCATRAAIIGLLVGAFVGTSTRAFAEAEAFPPSEPPVPVRPPGDVPTTPDVPPIPPIPDTPPVVVPVPPSRPTGDDEDISPDEREPEAPDNAHGDAEGSDRTTTRPASTRPTTTRPTTRPVRPGSARSFPTPAEMLARLRGEAEQKAQQLTVAYVDLSDVTIVERPSGFSLFGDPGMPLRELVGRVTAAREDADVRAVLLNLGTGTGLSLAQAQELREELSRFRAAGKRSFVYADSLGTPDFVLASAATDVCLLPGGDVFLPGIGFETMFYKGLLDRVGVTADYVQIGEYKGADEPYTRTEPSDEVRAELDRLADGLYEQMLSQISESRGVTTAQVRRLIDESIVNASAARDRGFVDHLVDVDGLRDLIRRELGDGDDDEAEINLLHDYGAAERVEPDFSNPFSFIASLARRPKTPEGPQIAVVYAEGTIVDGSGGEGLFGDVSIGSEPIREAMRTVMRDDDIKAVVIRVDSPGGSALASEAMWQSVRRVTQEKWVIVSVGGMAASGGYYLASAGDVVFADPAAVIGSIGVVGGKFVLDGLYEKLGVTVASFHRGRNADLFSSSRPFDDRQKRLVRNWMRTTYDRFLERVKEGRGRRVDDLDAVARGRLFLGTEAKSLGLIDEIGGLEAAIRFAAERVELEPGGYTIRVLPEDDPMSALFGNRSSAKAGGAAGPFAELPPTLRRQLGQLLTTLRLFDDRPAVLINPWRLTVR